MTEQSFGLRCSLHGGRIDQQGIETSTELNQCRRFSLAGAYLGRC